MSRLTVAALVVLVAGLAFLAWRQSRTPDTSGTEVPLFENLDPGRVTKVHVENLERAAEMTFERDPAGGWLMTDPIRVRAESTVIEQLVSSAIARRGTPVNESELDTRKLGLEPPRFVLVLFDDKGARQQLDVGAADLDRNRVNVRARGKVLRAVRDFEVLLDFMPEEFQSHSATSVDPREVVEIHRRGSITMPDAPIPAAPTDLTLDALLEEGQWRATAPVAGLLDPLAMSIVLQNTAGLRFDHFTDNGDAPLNQLGLEPPDMTYELGMVRGETLKLVFGHKPSAMTNWWNGMLVGEGKVWSIPVEQAMALAMPVTDLLDRRVHRFLQSDINGIQLSTAEHEVKLEKGVFGWTVAEARAGSRVFAPPLPADQKRVADLLSALERAEIRAFVQGSQLGADESHDAIHVRTSSSVSAGGAFGRPGDQGGVRFQRDGENIVGIVEDSLLELARTPPQSFWSNSIIEIPEVDAVQLVLKRGEAEVTFERDRYGKWVRKGRQNEARELHPLLDPLLFLRAAQHLESKSIPLEDPIEVHWTLNATKKDLVVGFQQQDGARQVVAEFDGRRSVLKRQDLHQLLESVLAEPAK